MDDAFETKLGKAHAELEAAGIWPSNYNPPLYRMARALGLKIKPPHYQNLGVQAVIMGVFFGILFAMISTIGDDVRSLSDAFMTAVTAGGIFGVVMAGLTYLRRTQTKLSNWDDL